MPVERHSFTTRPFACSQCEHRVKHLGWDYDAPPSCPAHGPMDSDYGQFNRATAVIGDDIPGGIEVKHGLCNPDGSPRRYYSKSEMRAEARARGLEQHVVHIGEQGSDKSPHTTKWY